MYRVRIAANSLMFIHASCSAVSNLPATATVFQSYYEAWNKSYRQNANVEGMVTPLLLAQLESNDSATKVLKKAEAVRVRAANSSLQ